MKVAVIGGGISGLSCAYYLKKYVPWVSSVLVLEKHPRRWGGMILSETKTLPETRQPFILEYGPRALKPKGFGGFLASSLVQSLGLESKIIRMQGDGQYFVFNDQLERKPRTMKEVFLASRNPTSAMYRCLSSFLSEPFRWNTYRTPSSNDESLESFFQRHGWDGLLEQMVSAILHGVYAAHPSQLGIQSTFPSLKRAELLMRSVTLGLLPVRLKIAKEVQRAIRETPMGNDPEALRLWHALRTETPLYTLQHGVGTLVHALQDQLQRMDGVELCLGSAPTQVTLASTTLPTNATVRPCTLTYSQGDAVHAVDVDHLFVTAPLHTLSPSFLPSHTAQPVPCLDIGLVHVVFRAAEVPAHAVTQGFGCLAPLIRGPKTDPDLLGIVFPEGQPQAPGLLVYTVLMGGHYFDQLSTFPTHDELSQRARSALALLVGIPTSVTPAYLRAHVLQQCLPHYPPNAQLYPTLPNVSFVGTWYDSTGIQEGLRSAWEEVWKFKFNTAFSA